MAADIYVSFGADTGGLEAAMALAKSKVIAMAGDLRKLSNEMRKNGEDADSELGQKWRAAGANLARAKMSMASVSDELAKASARSRELAASSAAATTEHIGEAALHAGHGAGFFARELHALSDELSSGRYHQAIGTFTNVASGLLQANVALIPMIATFAEAAAVIGFFAYEAFEANAAAHAIQLDSVIDQFSQTTQQASHLAEVIAYLADVSKGTAAEIAKPFLALGAGGDLVAAMAAQYLPMLSKSLGETTPKAAEKLAEMFAELSTKGREYVAATHGVTTSQLQAYDQFVSSGQVGRAYAVILDALKSRLEEYRETLVLSSAATEDQLQATAAASGAASEFGDVISAAGGKVAKTTAELKEQAAAAEADRAALLGVTDAAKTLAAGFAESLKVDKIAGEIGKTTDEIRKMEAALKVAADTGDTNAAFHLARGLDISRDALVKLQQQSADGLLGRDAIAQSRDAIAAFDANFKGSTVQRLLDEKGMLQQLASQTQLSADQRHEIEKQLQSKDVEIRDASNKAFLASEDMKATAAALGKAKVIAIRQEEVKQEIATYGAGSDQAIEAEKRLAQAKEAAAKQGSSASRAAAKDELAASQQSIQGQIQQAQDAAKTQIQLLADEVKLKRITEAEKLSGTLAVLSQEASAVEALYAKEIALAGNKVEKIQQLQNQETHFAASQAEATMKAETEAAEASEKAWKGFADTTAGLINGQVDGLLRGTTSISQAFKNMTASALEDIVKFLVKWMAEHAAAVAANIAGLGAMTTATGASQTANLSLVMAGEGAKKAVNASSISGDAGRAAAGAYAAVAGIPIIGPVLAPVAAATAFGAVEAFGSFDIGAWSIPENQLAMVHKNELIMPAAQAGAFRQMLSNGGGGGDTHIHFSPQISAVDARGVRDMLNDYAPLFARTVAHHFDHNPSQRPKY